MIKTKRSPEVKNKSIGGAVVTPKEVIRELTEKEKMFVREFLVDLNATQAAIRAGFSERSARQIGSNLLAKVYIRKAITEAIKQRAEKVELTAEYVIEHLMELVARCMQEKPVMVFDYKSKQLVQATDEDGKGVWMFDSAGANKALRSLGEHLALFKKVIAGDKDNPLLFEPIKIIRPKIKKK